MPDPQIAGRIVDSKKRPLAGLSVRVHLRGSGDTRSGLEGAEYAGSAETDSDGGFFFTLNKAQSRRRYIVSVARPDSPEPLLITPPQSITERSTSLVLSLAPPEEMPGPAPARATPLKVGGQDLDSRSDLNLAGRDRDRAALTARLRTRAPLRKRALDLAHGLLHRLGGKGARHGTTAGPEQGVESLAAVDARGMRVHLDVATLERITEWLGHAPEAGDVLDGEQAAELRFQAARSTGSQRAHTLLEMCQTHAAPPFGGNGGSGGEVADDSAAEAEPALGDLINQLRRKISEPDSVVRGRRGLEDLPDGLSQSIATGPADVRATYDFETLTVAWRDVWQAALDGRTAEALSQIYEEMVQIAEPEVVDALYEAEVEDLETFLSEVSRAVGEANRSEAGTPPVELVGWLPETASSWASLDEESRRYLQFLWLVSRLRQTINLLPVSISGVPDEWFDRLPDPVPEGWAESEAESLLQRDSETSLGRLRGLIEGLGRKISEPWAFDVFKPDTCNFGIVSTFRQSWNPLAYQVGDLVGTLPLTPGETRTISTSTKTRTLHSESRLRAEASSEQSSSEQDLRTEGEIVARASRSARLATGGTAGFEIGLFNASGSFDASAEAGDESARTKRDIRNAVMKAARDYSDERKLEVSAEEERSSERSTTRALSNPNNEITVTYLFYELQRRFQVDEHLHRVTPVVLVAFEVPAPHRIDESWLLAHESDLRPALLDPQYREVFDLLRNGFAGGELAVQILERQWRAQLDVVASIRDNVEIHSEFRDAARAAFEQATESVPDQQGISNKLFSMIHGEEALEMLSGEEIESKAELAARREATRMALDWAEADFTQAQSRLRSAVTALRQATESYSEAVRKRLEARVRIDQFRVHVKNNIMTYMQAIWRAEPADQRYLRLYDIEVPWPTPVKNEWRFQPLAATAQANRFPGLPPALELVAPAPKLDETRRLGAVADLDSLLGFRGNYGVFPLNEGNALTDFMLQGRLDTWFGIADPDDVGDLPSPSEAAEVAACVLANDPSQADEEALRDWLKRVLTFRHRADEEIVVPSGQLFIEALPGAHPLLEDFKLRHRGIDLAKAAEDLQASRVERLRRLMRLDSGQLGAADGDRTIDVKGAEDLDLHLDLDG